MPGASSFFNFTDFQLKKGRKNILGETAFQFNKYCPVLRYISQKVDNVTDFEGMRYLAFQEIPSFLPVGDEYPVINNKPTPYNSKLVEMGFSTRISVVDAGDRRNGGLEKLFKEKFSIAMKPFGMELADRVVNGRDTGPTGADLDPDGFNGFRWRMSDAGRLKTKCEPFMKVDAVTAGCHQWGLSYTTDHLRNMLRVWDSMLYNMGREGGENTVIMAPDKILSLMAAAAATGDFRMFSSSKDALGREVLMFRGAKVIKCGWGYPRDNSANPTQPRQRELLTATEPDNGETTTGGTKSSVFIFSTDPEDMVFRKFQDDSPGKLNLRDGGVYYESPFFNLYGIEQHNPNAIGQINNITTA